MKNYFFTLCLVLLCLLMVGCGPPTKIRYEVVGTAPSVNITMHNSQGNIEQLSNVSLPWFKEFDIEKYTRDPNYDDIENDIKGSSYTAYISAQNNGDLGGVSVRIYCNGKERQTATSIGARVSATASEVASIRYGQCN
ncbi:MAG: hypothetical protein LBC85_10765 [Fibromonadaceae bacterium]|jgi:hypothetical protein|nr:hypothetical protein [Fibromonadaceae bacterium]